MAKQLLGKEVTAALNERIKANVAELQGKGVNPTLCIIRVGENQVIFLRKRCNKTLRNTWGSM